MEKIVNSLLESYRSLENSIPVEPCNQPNRSEVAELIDRLRCLLFPGYFDKKNLNPESIIYHTGELLESAEYLLNRQLLRLLNRKKKWKENELRKAAAEIVQKFLEKLPNIRKSLSTDVEAAYEGDPAALNKEEIITAYPGIFAISIYRLAHELYALEIPLLPRIMTEHAHSITGIDIHPGATIGDYFFIDHGTGIVIGETTVIGERVKIYQGVTLGALSTRGGQSLSGQKRHPTVEDSVTIYSGASIFGGNTIIGKGSILGSNVFVTKSVAPNSRVSINDGLKKHKQTEDNTWYFEI
ncbi:serine acetyltransferase [Fibrobacterales bacterium]|nr:serine acetyltransferase [Fibrobacterales bacterium]